METLASALCILLGFVVGWNAPKRILIPIAIAFVAALIFSRAPSDEPPPGIATDASTAPAYVYKEAREANRGLGPGGSIK